jgi:serine/threonine protein kinase
MASKHPASDTTGVYIPADEAIGDLIADRYQLLEKIGEGGMGEVWVAEQSQPVRRKVALKLIKKGMDSTSILARFEVERQALALMDHPHIAKVLDGGYTPQGRPFFVMEYIKGMPITRYCDEAKLPVQDRLGLFIRVCQAVQHAHQKGIIHRDLKPPNVLISLHDGKPVPKVIDFGLAKALHQPLTELTLHTAFGVMMGTPSYLSPEQAEGNPLDIDTRTDVYSLGVILYELLTGTTPLEVPQGHEATWQEMLRRIKEEEPPKPSQRLSQSTTVPTIGDQRQVDPGRLSRLDSGELDWIVMKCLEKDRSQRYETANALALDLERYLANEPVLAGPPSMRYRMRKFVRRHRGVVISASLVMLALIGGIIGTSLGLVEARRQKQDAEEQRHQAGIAAQLAQEEAKRANAINRFLLNGVFARQDPDIFGPAATGLETLEGLLDRAVEAMPQAFPDDPMALAELQLAIGDTYHNVNEMVKSEAQIRMAYDTKRRNRFTKPILKWALS